jgi:hypothetical protein
MKSSQSDVFTHVSPTNFPPILTGFGMISVSRFFLLPKEARVHRNGGFKAAAKDAILCLLK